VIRLKPGFSTSIRYWPGNKFTKEYKPSDPLCWTRFSAVPVFVSVTSAPEIAAPDESATNPAIDPYVVCADSDGLNRFATQSPRTNIHDAKNWECNFLMIYAPNGECD
jgi:hypothetical protein